MNNIQLVPVQECKNRPFDQAIKTSLMRDHDAKIYISYWDIIQP